MRSPRRRLSGTATPRAAAAVAAPAPGWSDLSEASDRDPAVRRARSILRKMRDDIATVDLGGAAPVERRALRLILAHLASGYEGAARGTA